jgi:hypothetical protein
MQDSSPPALAIANGAQIPDLSRERGVSVRDEATGVVAVLARH